ncbi:LUD domain-containing protein [Hymenobacter sp. 15J16-1T3B]|uniref:LutC/YkgG family protein n=1 Tax=Hymenobacter sp. 15J16-1T3B TaxID=2886941 RepID=UPI001D12BF95|nr:LUD domain-containing protein [Hymenobacter sp. 15J16-1T3B]MCC3160544.1 LUD domain-containing protein [Hymenobacter sp. 15J16-1T3B]
MSSRESILAAVRRNRPEPTPLPPVADFGGEATVEQFAHWLHFIGGQVIRLAADQPLEDAIRQLFPDAGRVASDLMPSTVPVDQQTPTAVLEAVDVAVLRGELGVAENGAVWVPEANMLHRALPMIAQHLALVLDHENIVATMHQAYAAVQHTGNYGVFIAGPSKTADIEQSLVIGAHGARSLVVLLR